MTKNCFNKIQSIVELHEVVPKFERIIVDILRQIMKEKLTSHFIFLRRLKNNTSI